MSYPGVTTLDKLIKNCGVLSLRNIRVLGKAIRFFEEFKRALPDDAPREFCDAALHSLLLFSWIKFTPDSVVSFEELEGFTVLGRSMARHARESTGEQVEDDPVENLLSEYGYQMTDDLDMILIRFVQNGILDTTELLDEYERYQNRTSVGFIEEQFRQTWKRYFHGTLRDNEDEFCEQLVEATNKYLLHASVEQIDSVLNVWVEAKLRTEFSKVVLNADDDSCRTMAEQADAGHVCYVTRDPSHSGLDKHLAAGGRAVVLEGGEGGGTITIRDGDGRIPVVATDRIPALRDKRYDVLTAMFAAAMAHALGKTADEIREGLCAFEPAGATTSAVDDASDAAPGDDVEPPNKSPVRDAG